MEIYDTAREPVVAKKCVTLAAAGLWAQGWAGALGAALLHCCPSWAERALSWWWLSSGGGASLSLLLAADAWRSWSWLPSLLTCSCSQRLGLQVRGLSYCQSLPRYFPFGWALPECSGFCLFPKEENWKLIWARPKMKLTASVTLCASSGSMEWVCARAEAGPLVACDHREPG